MRVECKAAAERTLDSTVAPCLSCGSRTMRRVRPYRVNTRFGRTFFGGGWLVECAGCRLVQLVPRPAPEQLNQFYVADYRKNPLYGELAANARQFPKDNLFYFNRGQSIRELLKPHVREAGPCIVDVGAGYGHILHALGEEFPGSRRLAIESSDPCVKHLRALGIEVQTQTAEEILAELERTADLIVLSHVLEHLLDPLDVLRRIHTALVPGGCLYVEVPNIPRETLPQYPDHRWAPRYDEPHITFFSKATLSEMIERAGFAIAFCDTAGPEYALISGLRFRLPPLRASLERTLPRSWFHFLRRQRFTRPVRVQEREESFRKYGGFRLWIRCVARKKTD